MVETESLESRRALRRRLPVTLICGPDAEAKWRLLGRELERLGGFRVGVVTQQPAPSGVGADPWGLRRIDRRVVELSPGPLFLAHLIDELRYLAEQGRFHGAFVVADEAMEPRTLAEAFDVPDLESRRLRDVARLRATIVARAAPRLPR